MTVLPNAPIDAATGLPVPTIAVATNGGVSVIKDDGTVISTVSDTGYKVHNIDLQSNGNLFAVLSNSSNANYAVTWAESYTGISGLSWSTYTNWNSIGGFYYASVYGSNLTYIGGNTGGTINDLSANAIGSFYGLTKTDKNPSDFDAGLVNFISSNYNTGWMNGDIKLATLSDTDATNVTGSELVTNGTFDSDTTGWTAVSGTTLSVDTNRLKVLQTTGSSAFGYQVVTTVVGETYVLTADFTQGSNVGAIRISGSSYSGTDLGWTGYISTSAVYKTFVATSTTTYISVQSYGGTGGYVFADNISVRLAEEDRSVNGNGLQVFGTVTKSAVATGADLVGYSGFSASNYLEQPYNSDLDFGTGDWCYTAWVKPVPNGTNQRIFSHGSGSTEYIALLLNAGNVLIADLLANGGSPTSLASSYTPATGVWVCVSLVSSSGTITMFVNGKSVKSTSYAMNMSSGGSRFFVGLDNTGVQAWTGSIALFRASATAPSPEQIKKIYEDEKVLFQENAQATLYGSSDAVTALAYDDTTELLHVGTSAGRSVFQGLRRVDNTTDAVGAAISASNGLVAED
jgi:roadblock/LC7 domain-containing protein